MVIKRVFAVASAAFVALSLSVTANGETLKITTSDANNKSSLVTWNVSGGGTAAPCKGNTYVVDTKLMVRTPNDQKTFSFAGDLLRIGSSDGDYGTLAPCRNSAIGTVTFPGVNGAAGLILEKGFIQPYKANSTMTIAGKVKVTALDSDPFVIRLVGGDTATNNQVVLSATLEGERSTMLRTLVYKQEKMRPSFVALDCDASNFMGTFDVYSYDKDRPCDCYLYNSHSFGGELIVRKWSSLLPQYASTLWTIGTLRLDAGSTLATKLTINSQRGGIPETSTITLTEGLMTTSPVNLTFTGGARRDTDAAVGYEWSVLKLPKAKAEQIHPEHFVLASQNTSFPKDDFYVGLIVRTNENDVSLNVISRKRVYMTETLATGKRGFGYDPDYEYYTAATNAAAWSDGKTLGSPDVDYVSGSHLNLAPPSLCDANHAYVFPGASLTMSNSMTLCTAARQVTFPVLRMMLGSQYWPLTDEMTETTVVRGQIYLVNSSTRYPAYVRVRTGMSVDVQADLSGASGCCLQIQPNVDNATGCRIAFGHDNSDYKGSIFVAGNSDGVSDFANGQTLVLQAANNVGGSLTSFSADALSLFRFATLEVTNDLVFATANRGLTVNNAQIKVGEGATFIFANDITYAGPLTKVGAGRLVLGGTAQGSAKTLTVAEGTFAVSTDTVLDGVAVTFTGGALAVNPATAGDYGMKGPFSGNLPVAFDLPADEETHEYSNVAVCTVDASANVSPKAVRIPRHRVVFHWRDNNNGTKTLLADISRTGCAIILR